jgi:hypothetical protein
MRRTATATVSMMIRRSILCMVWKRFDRQLDKFASAVLGLWLNTLHPDWSVQERLNAALLYNRTGEYNTSRCHMCWSRIELHEAISRIHTRWSDLGYVTVQNVCQETREQTRNSRPIIMHARVTESVGDSNTYTDVVWITIWQPRVRFA